VCTPICGDGVDVGAAEVCDDGNALACGTCSGNAGGTAAGCTNLITSKASGSVTPVAAMDLNDGTTFTINDGFNPAVTFEFDTDDSVTNSATLIAIDFQTTWDDATLRSAVVTAINSVTGALLITASNGTPAREVQLVHDRVSGRGNQAITTSSADVAKVDMAGGLAGNCTTGTGCVNDADCQSFDCDNTNHCAP
jgi:hypothetical protein